MKVWVVTQDAGGAHEPENAVSIWTTEAGADAERDRLEAKENAREYGGRYGYYVCEVETDVPAVVDDYGSVSIIQS